VKSYPDDNRAGEEEVLELVGVAVGAHVEEVLVTAELLEGEATPVKACAGRCEYKVEACG